MDRGDARRDEELTGVRTGDAARGHALDVDATGDVLAIGSTTGNLWVSEDGGDHWETVSTSLPPVQCVRFGP